MADNRLSDEDVERIADVVIAKLYAQATAIRAENAELRARISLLEIERDALAAIMRSRQGA